MKQISILGCGWLGLPLAKSLLIKGFSVNGSTTSIDKMDVLKNVEIIPFQIQLFEDKIEGNIDIFLKDSEILILDIPPKLRGNSKENFVQKVKNLIPFIEKSTIKKVIFVSSTSVYEDTFTEQIVTEEIEPDPNTESGKQLLQTEQLLLANIHFKTSVVRFGGLIGIDRNPITFLSGKTDIENPNAPINLIHQGDCIGIIEALIEKGLQQAQTDNNFFNEVFHAVAPFHPSRKEYYTQKAIELNLPLPKFNESKPSVGKTILSTKIEPILKYTFQYSL